MTEFSHTRSNDPQNSAVCDIGEPGDADTERMAELFAAMVPQLKTLIEVAAADMLAEIVTGQQR